MSHVVAVVLKGYPRLSETFIAQEIHALEKRGLNLRLVSLRQPTDTRVHPVHEEIKAPVLYLPEYLYRAPLRVWRAWRAVRNRENYARARAIWLSDLRHDPTPNRIRRFGQALVLAHEIPSEITWLHAHFLHTPASVARYAARILDLPWSCSAHAKDIWTTPTWEKSEKLDDMQWLVTCTRVNADHLAELGSKSDHVNLVYHGLDFDRLPGAAPAYSARDGSDPEHPVVLLSVGRAVEKKGYPVLIDALAQLPDRLAWRLVHIGGGAALPKLKAQANRAGLGDRIDWTGAQPHGTVFENYRKADVFVLASLIAKDGDRDGLPNVLMEAQSQGLVCLSSEVSGVPELIADGETGLLSPPGDRDALRGRLQSLIENPDLRRKLGTAGRNRVRSEFSCEKGIDLLSRKFGLM